MGGRYTARYRVGKERKGKERKGIYYYPWVTWEHVDDVKSCIYIYIYYRKTQDFYLGEIEY